jgi:hypothetical protein
MPITKTELEFHTKTAENLARIEGKIDVLHAKLEPVMELKGMVTEHDRQIHHWKGVNATLMTVILALISVTGSLYAKFRHWF